MFGVPFEHIPTYLKGYYKYKAGEVYKDENGNIVKDNKTMIAIASWAEKEIDIKLIIDWKQLQIDPRTTSLYGPEIPLFQDEIQFEPTQTFKVKKGKGYLLILQ